ncbi:hypothetical protein BH11VER1_BH11VER1_08120 [soil metagenome]
MERGFESALVLGISSSTWLQAAIAPRWGTKLALVALQKRELSVFSLKRFIELLGGELFPYSLMQVNSTNGSE